MKRRVALSLCSALVAAASLLTGTARAQTVDVSALESLFGEPVTTSATGEPQRLSDVPADMEIITQDQIRRSGADNIPEVLRFVAGLNVREYGVQDQTVSIRGRDTADNPRVLVLVDGRQAFQDDYGHTVWSAIPVTLREIRQIEIIKGPAAALYGFNAVSGVINIVTSDPLKVRTNSIVVSGGSLGEAYGEAVTTANAPGQYGVRLSAKGFRSDDFSGVYETASSGAIQEQARTASVAIDARVVLHPGLEWDAAGSIGDTRSDYFVDIGGYAPNAIQTNFVRSRLAGDTQAGLLQFDLYRNENKSYQSTPGFSSGWRDDVVVASASDLVRVSTNSTVRAALEFRENDISSLQTFLGSSGYEIGAASLMWNLAATRNLRIVNALRIDTLFLHHKGGTLDDIGVSLAPQDVALVEPSFNSGVVLKIDAANTMRLTVARAVQLPSLLDYAEQNRFAGGAVIVVGNADVSPSPVMNYELDLDHRLPALASSVRLAVFLQQATSMIGSPFGSGVTSQPGSFFFQARNFGNDEEAGGELEMSGKLPNGLHWNLGYALAGIHDQDNSPAETSAPSVNPQRQTPTNAVVGTLGTTWRRIDLDVSARWQSRFQDYRLVDGLTSLPVTISNYVTADARASYHIDRRSEVALTIEQFNAQSLIETAGSPVSRRILASVRCDL